MGTVKDDVRELLRKLPDDCTLEDVQYHLYILEKIRRGVEDADAGRTLTQDDVGAQLSEWLSE
jgi:predicted transcriptional regulator